MTNEAKEANESLFDARWRAPVDLAHASRLVGHGPTVMIGARHEGRRNLMSAAWSMPVEFAPPRIAVVIDKSTWTRELVVASGVLAIMVPCVASADLCYTVGSESGRDLAAEGADKFVRHGIDTFDGPALALPLATACIAWLECRLLREPGVEDRYDTFFCEVVAAQADTRVFRDGRWVTDDVDPRLHTLHYMAAGRFAVASTTLHATMLPAIA